LKNLDSQQAKNVVFSSLQQSHDGYFVPEQIWDRSDIACYAAGRPAGSAAPLNWAEGQ
jgi:glucoamylase